MAHDFEQRLHDVSAYYTHPRDILIDKSLSTTEKKALLERWEYDVREMLVAEEENMQDFSANKHEQDLLPEILNALSTLNGDHDEGSSPTKQG